MGGLQSHFGVPVRLQIPPTPFWRGLCFPPSPRPKLLSFVLISETDLVLCGLTDLIGV